MTSNLGRRIDGRYQLQELIGVGGMANVYRARDLADGKTVAVKILKPEYNDNAEFLRRFKNESRAISLLDHPNIIKVYDVSFAENAQSIVMEYVDGVTLKEYIETRRILSYKEALLFTEQILAALQHAHDRGIVHRDMKPQNIMLLADGTVKITDFGIARFARSETKSITDRAIGSVHYISPEQASGANADGRTDLYSVGVMLFEMLTGQLPFEADTAVSVALKQIQARPTLPRALNPDIPEGLEEIILRAMQKDLTQRYQTAAEMLRDIDAFKRDPSVSFNYRYLTAENSSTQVGRTVEQIKKKPKAESLPSRVRLGAGSRKPRPKRPLITRGKPAPAPQEPEGAVRPSWGLPILGGVTLAFVFGTLIFIGTVFFRYNPFVRVAETKVPALVGQSYSEALKSGQLNSFRVELEGSALTDTYEKGLIYEQSPAVGKQVKVGSAIKVKVSEGRRKISLPNYGGTDATEAEAKLRSMDLNVTRSETFSSTVKAGMVVYVQPNPGSTLYPGDAVTLFVSVGPDATPVTVPHVVGMKLADARSAIESSELVCGGVTYIASTAPFGTVLAQNPEAAIEAPGGSVVDLNVSGGNAQQTLIRLAIPLPPDKEPAKLQAMVKGEIILEEVFIPAEVLIWNPSFEGTYETLNVLILYNGKLYQQFSISFGEQRFSLIEDRSSEFIS